MALLVQKWWREKSCQNPFSAISGGTFLYGFPKSVYELLFSPSIFFIGPYQDQVQNNLSPSGNSNLKRNLQSILNSEFQTSLNINSKYNCFVCVSLLWA